PPPSSPPRRSSDLMLQAAHVGKAQVNELDVVVLGQFEDGIDGHCTLQGSGKGQAGCGCGNAAKAVPSATGFKSLILRADSALASSKRTTMRRKTEDCPCMVL